ncbi:ATP-grasp domain-containing protein [Leptospira santarosai]|uniref:ATP-grasp domain-containing protein n=3 Tax=Leptospira santarosai TaxID=28183 RepID=UPI0003466076|nr:ATP-grasp domain-containing protein [Leptospira santarosai]MDI7191037.1 ATP-grasp domain-containing protein [Leptospira santarosai]
MAQNNFIMKKKKIYILHNYQLIGKGMRQALPKESYDVCILTSGYPNKVFRSDVINHDCEIIVVNNFSIENLSNILLKDSEILTNDESCISDCTQLRKHFSLPIRSVTDISAYTNKIVMKNKLSDSNIGTPNFVQLHLNLNETKKNILENLKFPLVLKPDKGGYNSGIAIIKNKKEFADWLKTQKENSSWHAEEFIDGKLFHANAFVMNGEIFPVQVCAYTHPPLESNFHSPLGSITLPNTHPIYSLGHELNEKVIKALGSDGCFVVHTEFFISDNGKLFVIDVAGRAPGALVSDIAEISSGVNLEKASLLLQLGEQPEKPSFTGTYSAWTWSSPHKDGNVSCLLLWNKEFKYLLFDLEKTSSGMEGVKETNWLKDLDLHNEVYV